MVKARVRIIKASSIDIGSGGGTWIKGTYLNIMRKEFIKPVCIAIINQEFIINGNSFGAKLIGRCKIWVSNIIGI